MRAMTFKPYLRLQVLFLGALAALQSATAVQSAELGIAPSGRHLTLGGKPFFWLGDTVWLLAQVPSREDIDLYLKTRAEQGFTVIQLTAVMGEERVWGTKRATSLGDLPFVEHDVARPAVTPGNDPAHAQQYDYWDHLDYVIDRIHAHGFRTALVTYFVGWQGEGYNYLKKENAYGYGRFLGERFRGKPEIFWLLGGDNTPNTDDKKAVWNLVAKGITQGLTGSEEYSGTVMTYHINGGASSAQIWHESPWLDFNMAQTWSAYQDIYPAVQRDFQKQPVKPCGLGEGAYEDGPQYPTKPINGLVIRKQACWSYFAGGYHTYGNGNVWHFDTLKAELTQPWRQALRSAGAESLKHVKAFLHSANWWNLVPDQSVFADGAGSGANLNTAMRNAEGSGIAVYLSSAAPVKLDLNKLTAKGTLTAAWVNPATGEKRPAEATERRVTTFNVPTGWSDAFLQVTAK
jgi:hypothetical protein